MFCLGVGARVCVFVHMRLYMRQTHMRNTLTFSPLSHITILLSGNECIRASQPTSPAAASANRRRTETHTRFTLHNTGSPPPRRACRVRIYVCLCVCVYLCSDRCNLSYSFWRGDAGKCNVRPPLAWLVHQVSQRPPKRPTDRSPKWLQCFVVCIFLV